MKTVLLSSDECDRFVDLRGNDLLELLTTVENLLIEYRYRLGLSNKVTFGIEIEYEEVRKSLVDNFVRTNISSWQSGSDSTVASGGEIRSPILTDQRKSWQELKRICEYLKENNAVMNHTAGGHIHTGVQALGTSVDAWRLFIKLYMIYEHIMMRFFFGDKINGRASLAQYAPPVADSIYERLTRINEAHIPADIICQLPHTKYGAINFGHVQGYSMDKMTTGSTVELRCPNGTSEEVIWQNNINAYAKMQESCRKQLIDEDYLDYKIRFFEEKKDKFYQNEVILKTALEFVDLVFDNNLDKMYFLRQYIKNFQSGADAREAVFAKSFIK